MSQMQDFINMLDEGCFYYLNETVDVGKVYYKITVRNMSFYFDDAGNLYRIDNLLKRTYE